MHQNMKDETVQEKEKLGIFFNKKRVAIVAVMCILLIGTAAAYAVTMNIWGLGDFLSRYAEESGAKISEKLDEAIHKENATVETGHAIYTILESYYDEVYIRVAMTVYSKDDALLIDH